MKTKKDFFKEALKNMKTSGTIMPSSRFLIKKLLNDIDFISSKVIVEFGPGNGIITQQILNKMAPDALLICFEINDYFYRQVKQINDDRLYVVNASAEHVKKELNNLNIKEVNCFISSLPLTNIPNEIAINILTNSKEVLCANGQFIQYQYSLTFFKKLKQVFNENNVNLKFEFLNVPPAFIYFCEK